MVVVVLPTVVVFVCGIIAESSPVDAFSIAPLWTRVGGRSTPFHGEPETVIRVTPDMVRAPDNEARSDPVEVMSKTSQEISNQLHELTVAPVKSAGQAITPLPVTGVAMISTVRVSVLDIFPAASVFV